MTPIQEELGADRQGAGSDLELDPLGASKLYHIIIP